MTKIIAVDVDIVLAASDKAWWEWLQNVTGVKGMQRMPSGTLEYNLTSYFKKALDRAGRDGFDFWRGTNVYDWVDPVPGSVAALHRLKSNLDCRIVAVSHVKGNHHKNKYQWLQLYFGDYLDGYVATKEKDLVRCDYLIDDRIRYLNRMPDEVKCIQLATPYTQDEEQKRPLKLAQNWDHAVSMICKDFD